MFSGIFGEGGFCDPTFRIGLHVFKKHPVESRQPRPHSDRYIRKHCERDVLISHGSRHLSGGLAFLGGFAFVVFFFAFRQSKLDLHEVSFSIDPKGNECQAVRSNLSDKALRLAFLDQEAPRARRLISQRIARVLVEGNERVGQHKVVSANGDEAPLEAHMSGLDRLYLVPEQSDARLDRLEDFIIKPRAFVEGDDGHREYSSHLL